MQQKAAEARKASFKAELPDVKAQPLAGKATLDDKVQIEVQTLVYRSTAESAQELATELKKVTGIKRVIIHNVDDVAALYAFNTLSAQLDSLKQQYEAILSPPRAGAESAALAPVAVASVLGSIVDIAALFRSDVELKGHAVSPEHAALVSQLQHALGDQVKVVYPAAYLPLVPPAKGLADSAVLKAFNDLVLLHAQADARIKALESQSDEEKQSAGKANSAIKAEAEEAATLRALNALYDKAAGVLMAMDESTGATGLTRLLRAESLASMLGENDTYLLLLAVVAAGGNNRVTQNLWWSAKVAHSGGSVIHYQLFDKDGSVKQANVLPNYIGYVSFKTHEELTHENMKDVKSVNSFTKSGA